jgi:hypothetical protein
MESLEVKPLNSAHHGLWAYIWGIAVTMIGKVLKLLVRDWSTRLSRLVMGDVFFVFFRLSRQTTPSPLKGGEPVILAAFSKGAPQVFFPPPRIRRFYQLSGRKTQDTRLRMLDSHDT